MSEVNVMSAIEMALSSVHSDFTPKRGSFILSDGTTVDVIVSEKDEEDYDQSEEEYFESSEEEEEEEYWDSSEEWSDSDC